MANGRLSSSTLAPIPGGRLRRDAAAAWNAGPAKGGLRPLGSQSSYRDYAGQLYFWKLYKSGRGNLAAYPGTSNHGWGVAVDLAAPWMRSWMNAHGARYGWRKTEAFSEWWHINYVGGFRAAPRADPLKGLTKRERLMASRLIYHRREYRREAKTGKGRKYRAHYGYAKYWRGRIEKHMAALRKDGLTNRHNRKGRFLALKRVVERK